MQDQPPGAAGACITCLTELSGRHETCHARLLVAVGYAAAVVLLCAAAGTWSLFAVRLGLLWQKQLLLGAQLLYPATATSKSFAMLFVLLLLLLLSGHPPGGQPACCQC
jgi:hypothetical protein